MPDAGAGPGESGGTRGKGDTKGNGGTSGAAGGRLDVVMLTDCRLPGGTVASVVEEIRAQHRAGLRTGVVHVPSPLVGRPRPFNPRLLELIDAGAAEVVLDPVVEAGVAVLRHPAVFTHPDVELPRLEVDRAVMVLNQTPRDDTGEQVFYDVDAMREMVEPWFGDAVEYAPIGPLTRQQVEAVAPELPMRATDWVNVIDVDHWAVDPDLRFRTDRPVIGRHSRSDAKKWPDTRDDILAAYPDDPAVQVRILGGADPARRILGRIPGNWKVYPFGALPPAHFLADLDAWVYFHHPAWVEAFGRTILEALASGVPTILPGHFEPLFGPAPVYATPEQVLPQVLAWRDDPDAARKLSAAGQHLVRERFGYEAHIARVRALLAAGRPGTGTSTGTDTEAGTVHHEGASVTVRATEQVRTPGTRVLFVSSNGAGVGHLMRLMAMARRASDGIVPVFLTLSQAVPVVRQNGFAIEYFMSRGYCDLDHKTWHLLFRERLGELIRTHDVRAIVFDGIWPYHGLLDAMADHPHVKAIWSRRGMWRPDVENPTLAASDRFDLILEPGEFAEAMDAGPTASRRDEVTQVAPITFLDDSETLDRRTARVELGLDPDRPAALVQLGAGNINDVSSLSGAVIERLTREQDLQVCVTQSIIAGSTEQADQADRRQAISLHGIYPLARYLRAFDLAVAASGYNTYHELLAAGVATLFIPNLDTSSDDQGARSQYAEQVGAGFHVPDPSTAEVMERLEELLEPARRTAMGEAGRSRYPGNGAADAMAAIEQVLGVGDGPLLRLPTGDRGTPVESSTPKPIGSTVGTAPAAGITRLSGKKAKGSWRRKLRRSQRMKADIAWLAASPRVRAIGRYPFRVLPTPARALVRRYLARWDRLNRRTAPRPTVAALPAFVPPATLLPAEERIDLPGVAVVLGPDLEPAARLAAIDRLAGLQIAHRDFAPLVVTFDADLAPIRARGLSVELLMPAEDWERLEDRATWPEYVRNRFAHLRQLYRIDQVIVHGTIPELDDLELLALMVTRPRSTP